MVRLRTPGRPPDAHSGDKGSTCGELVGPEARGECGYSLRRGGNIHHLRPGIPCVWERRFGILNETLLRQYVWGRYVDELLQQREVE